MNILLIDPASTYYGPNLGLLYLSASIERGKHNPFLLDLNNFRVSNNLERIVSLIDSYKIDIVGFSVCDVNYEWSVDISKQIKSKRSISIIFGGPQANSVGSEILQSNPCVDYVIAGECEESIHSFLDALECGASVDRVHGVFSRSNESSWSERQVAAIDIDKICPPNYSHIGLSSLSGYMLLTTRGCPYKCTFCTRNTGKKWRQRSVASCTDEIADAIKKLKIKSFRIVDASFNLKEDRVIEFCDNIKARNIDIPWMVSGIRADRLTYNSAQAMRDAGCGMLAIGAESINPEVFNRLQKGETLEDIFHAIEICKEAGLEAGLYMIHGLPGDTYDASIMYARQLQRMRPDYVMYNQAVPFRGTELYEWAKEKSTLTSSIDWRMTRSLDEAPYETNDFSAADRVKSFRIIQTITNVINFTSEDIGTLDGLYQRISDNDNDNFDEHKNYINETIRLGKAKNFVKLVHDEKGFNYLEGYTGCVDIKNNRYV
jgi:anaerobic magnesium-protoporphyrin IX monomethyl ester cyclase